MVEKRSAVDECVLHKDYMMVSQRSVPKEELLVQYRAWLVQQQQDETETTKVSTSGARLAGLKNRYTCRNFVTSCPTRLQAGSSAS